MMVRQVKEGLVTKMPIINAQDKFKQDESPLFLYRPIFPQ